MKFDYYCRVARYSAVQRELLLLFMIEVYSCLSCKFGAMRLYGDAYKFAPDIAVVGCRLNYLHKVPILAATNE